MRTGDEGMVAVRCFAEQTAEGWEAHCVDLGIRVEGATLDSVKSELDGLIHAHIERHQGVSASASPRRAAALLFRYWGLYIAGRLGLRSDMLRDDCTASRGAPSLRPQARSYPARMVARNAP